MKTDRLEHWRGEICLAVRAAEKYEAPEYINNTIIALCREQHEADIKAIEVAIINVRAIVANTDPAFLDLITAIEKTLNSITFEDTQQSAEGEDG